MFDGKRELNPQKRPREGGWAGEDIEIGSIKISERLWLAFQLFRLLALTDVGGAGPHG